MSKQSTDLAALQDFLNAYGYLMDEILRSRITFWTERKTLWEQAALTEEWEKKMTDEQVQTWTNVLLAWESLTEQVL